MAETTDVSSRPSPRVGYLDNLKVLLTGGVIVAHAAMTYGAAGTWVYEEHSLGDVGRGVLSAFVGVGVLFGLGLFFLVAGLLTAAPLARRGPRRFLASRLRRLGAPLVAYVLFVWPALRWRTDRVQKNDTRPFLRHWRDDFTGNRWTSAGSGPMWFVAILLLVTTGWSLWRWMRPAGERPASPITGRAAAIAAGAVAAATFVLRVAFPIDSPQFLDIHVWMWPQSAVLFVVGALAAERGWLDALPSHFRRGCLRALLVATTVLVALIFLSDGPDGFKGGFRWEALGFAAFEGVFSVCVSLLLLDRFRRRHDRQGPVSRVLARAAYAAFVLQGPVLVLIALAIRDVDLPGEVKFLVLASSALTACYGLGMAFTARRSHRRGRRSALSRPPY